MSPEPTLKPVPPARTNYEKAAANAKRKRFLSGLSTYLIGVAIGCILLGLMWRARTAAYKQQQQQNAQQATPAGSDAAAADTPRDSEDQPTARGDGSR